jgi:alkyl sulfatase BDS1-like metallo-beta-lactamase superfamily hydrolase
MRPALATAAGPRALCSFEGSSDAASEIGMYLPDYRTALIADEVYIAFPNLYTLRGAKFRDAMRWAAASEKVLARDVDLLLGCHMAPLEGREQIEQVKRPGCTRLLLVTGLR